MNRQVARGLRAQRLWAQRLWVQRLWSPRMWLLALLLVVTGSPSDLGADDVPAAAKKDYDEAKALYVKGDTKSLAAAFSALSKSKGKAGESADFWELFARVWRASKKPEADLWEKIILPREQAMPACSAFDLVRARLESDPAKKREHLQKAVAKDPAAAAPKLMLARELRAQGEETQAEELVEKILEQSPDNEEALVVKSELMLEGGLSRSAMNFAKERLAIKEVPGLRHALALAQRKLVEEDASLRAEALANAQKAVDGRADPAFVATLADLLDESDRMPEAVALLKKHVETGKDPRLAQRLGAFAWRAGDYDGAVAHLATAATTDVKSAKALALAHARRNRVKEAAAASEQMLALDKEAWESAAEIALELGDSALLRKRIEGRTGEAASYYKAAADCVEGKVAQVAAQVGTQASDGSREGEEMLLLLIEARLNAKLGGRLAPYSKQVRVQRAQVVGAVVPAAKAEGKPVEMTGKSGEFMRRAVTYMRSVCGTWFEAGEVGIALTIGGSAPQISCVVQAQAPCSREPQRHVSFKLAVEGDVFAGQPDNPSPEVWEAASKAFTEGCAAMVLDDNAKAAEAFGKALEQEGSWHRAKLLRSIARGCMPNADLPTAAREALEAAASNPEDWYGRELAIKLSVLAGLDPVAPLKELLTHQDARSRGPLADL